MPLKCATARWAYFGMYQGCVLSMEWLKAPTYKQYEEAYDIFQATQTSENLLFC